MREKMPPLILLMDSPNLSANCVSVGYVSSQSRFSFGSLYTFSGDAPRPWAGREPMPWPGCDDEPAAYTMRDSALLELSEEKWTEVWTRHVKYREDMLKKLNYIRKDTYNIAYNNVYACERHAEAAHAKLRSIMLERRLRRLEVEVMYAPSGRGAEAAKVEFDKTKMHLSGSLD